MAGALLVPSELLELSDEFSDLPEDSELVEPVELSGLLSPDEAVSLLSFLGGRFSPEADL